MDHRIVAILSLLGLAAGQGLWAAPPTAAPVSHLLDGKTFYGREGMKGATERSQIYVFKNGTFEAREWGTNGFHPGPYTARREGNAILFSAETPGSHSEAARWQGKVVGDHLEVTGAFSVAGHPPIAVAGKADLGQHARDAMMFEQTMGQGQKLPQPGTPEYEHARQLAFQKITVANIRNLGIPLYSWLTDQVEQVGLAGLKPGDKIDLQSYPLVTAEQMRKLLVPEYLKELDATDGWGHPIELRVALKGLQGKHVMCLRSPGRDGKFSGDSYKLEGFAPADVDQDIVWCDGSFVRWPQRASTQ
jgi:hypothetical protein